MKKFIFICMTLLVMLTSSANAQKAIETSRFTDNTSITLQGGIVTPFTNIFEDGTITPTVVLGIDKYLTPWLGVGVEGRGAIGTGNALNTHTVVDAINVSGLVKINILNLISFKGTKRFFEPVPYAAVGWGHTTCSDFNVDPSYVTTGQQGLIQGLHTTASSRNYMTFRSGVECNFNLGQSKAWSIVVNPSVVWGDICNGRLDKRNANFEITAGIKYNFKNSNGTRTFKVWDITALNDEINALLAENEALKNRKPDVIEKIIIKEKTTNSVTVVPFDLNSSELSAAAKSILDKIPSTAEVSIVGTASPEGSNERNSTLSNERATNTAAYLQTKGVKVTSAKGDDAGRVAIVTIAE